MQLQSTDGAAAYAPSASTNPAPMLVDPTHPAQASMYHHYSSHSQQQQQQQPSQSVPLLPLSTSTTFLLQQQLMHQVRSQVFPFVTKSCVLTDQA